MLLLPRRRLLALSLRWTLLLWGWLLTFRLRRPLLLMFLLLALLHLLLRLFVLSFQVLELPLLLLLHLLSALIVRPLLVRPLALLCLLLFDALAFLILLSADILQLSLVLLLELRIAVRRRIRGPSRWRPVVALVRPVRVRRPVWLHVWRWSVWSLRIRWRRIWPFAIRWTVRLCIRGCSVRPVSIWPLIIRWSVRLHTRRRSVWPLRIRIGRPCGRRTVVALVRPVSARRSVGLRVRRYRVRALRIRRTIRLRIVVWPVRVRRRRRRPVIWLNVTLLLRRTVTVLRGRCPVIHISLGGRGRSRRRSHPYRSCGSRLLSLHRPHLRNRR